MNEPLERFRDDGVLLHDFAHEILVVCPRCEGCAASRPQDPEATGWSLARGPRRLTCGGCGYVAEPESPELRRRTTAVAADGHFGLPLWLQAPYGTQVLWAYNEAHLDWLEGYVRARHRERPPTGMRSSTMACKLPPWIKSARNRDGILAKLAELRRQLRSGSTQ